MDDDTKQQVMISLVAFNVVAMVYGFYRVFSREEPWNIGAAIGTILLAAVIGGVVAGVTFVATSFLKK